MVSMGRILKKRITLNLIESLNTKKHSTENLKNKLQTYSSKLQSTEPLWKLAIKLFLRVGKDKKIAVRNSLCLVNYYLKLLAKKFLVTPPQYCEATWNCLNELWTIMENSIKYTNLMKGNSMAIEQITAHLIDINILTLEVSPGSDCFDIFNRLSLLHGHKRDSGLDVLLHCKTLVVPQWRKIGLYVVVLRKILESYSNEVYDCSTFFKLCLIARIMLIMVKENNECKDLLLEFCQELKIPSSIDNEKFGGEYKLPRSNKKLIPFIKNIDVVSIFKSLYSPKKVNLMDDTFGITERQESLKCNKKVSTLKSTKHCEEQDLKTTNEPRDLFPTAYNGLTGAQKNGKNIENVDPLDKFRPQATKKTEGEKSAKLLMNTKKTKSEITSKVSKANCQKVINNNSDQPLMDLNNPRDLFSEPAIISKNKKDVKKLGRVETNSFSDLLNNKKNPLNDFVGSIKKKNNKECNSELLGMSQQVKKARKLENVNESVDEFQSISKKKKVDLCGTFQPNLSKTQMSEKKLPSSDKNQITEAKIIVGIRMRKRDSKKNCVASNSQMSEKNLPNADKNLITEAKQMVVIKKRKRNTKHIWAITNSSQSGVEDKANSSSIVLNVTAKPDNEARKRKILMKKSILSSKEAKTCNDNNDNNSIAVQKVTDNNIKIKKPRIKKLKGTEVNASDQTVKLNENQEDLRLADEEKLANGCKDNDFWTVLTGENNGKAIKSISKNRHRRPKKLIKEEMCPKVTETKNNTVMPIDDPTSKDNDSDVEILDETHFNPSDSVSVAEREESEIDEASGSEDDIVPNDDSCSMFSKEESSDFEKKFKEERRMSVECDLENKIVDIPKKIHLEIDVSSDDTSVCTDIKYNNSTGTSDSFCTSDKSHHESTNENDPWQNSYKSGDITDVTGVNSYNNIANIVVDLVYKEDQSKETEGLVKLKENCNDMNISTNNINLNTDDTIIIHEHKKLSEDNAPVTESGKIVSDESISPLKVIETGSDHDNGTKSPIESIMVATNYNAFDRVISKDNKENIENNEQEGEELEVLSTSSLETGEEVLYGNLTMLTPIEQRNSRSPSIKTRSKNLSNSASKSLFTMGNRQKLIQEIISPSKKITSPHFPSPQKVPTSALMGSELIISPGVSDAENEIGKEISSHTKIIESLPSVDQPDPWIRSKSPQKITQEEQTDIIDKSSLSENLIKKSPIKLVSKNRSNQLVNVVGTAKSPIKGLQSPVKSTTCPQILSVTNPLPTLTVKSPVLTKSHSLITPPKKLHSTTTNLNSKSPSPRATNVPVNADKFSERNNVDISSPKYPQINKRSTRLSLSKTQNSLRTVNNIDSMSPMKNVKNEGNSEIKILKVIPGKAAFLGTEECITENVITSPSKSDKDGTMIPNVVGFEAESTVNKGRVKSSSVSPINSSVSLKGTKLATVNEISLEKLEDSVPSDSEDRDKVFSPIKRSTRSSTIARRLSITSATISELDLNSPRRTRRGSISSVTTQDELSSMKLLESPVRARTRRNSAANTLTPVRRSRRISGIIDEFKETK